MKRTHHNKYKKPEYPDLVRPMDKTLDLKHEV